MPYARTCSRVRPTKTRSSSSRPARRCASSARCSTRPSRTSFCSSGADHVETFSVTCVPTFAIVAGSRAIARFAGREHNLPIHREMAEDILQQAGHREQLRHGLFRRRRARPRVRGAVRIRHRQPRYPGDSVLHQRLRAAATDDRALRRASAERSPRSSRDARSGWRSSPAAACRTSPAPPSICIRNSISIAGWFRSSRRAIPMPC